MQELVGLVDTKFEVQDPVRRALDEECSYSFPCQTRVVGDQLVVSSRYGWHLDLTAVHVECRAEGSSILCRL